MVFGDRANQDSIITFINPFWSAPELDPNTKFITDITLPIHNKGTIHINPEGKITIHELNGKQLTSIGKELIKNQNGAVIGEETADYLTINEENGNVLPGTNRIFTMSWNGFARKYVTASGAIAINYEAPGIYYSRISKENQGYLYPWEKLEIHHTVKNLSARINVSYINPVTKEVVIKDSEIPLTVEYDEIIKTWNSGLIATILIALSIYLIVTRRRRKQKMKSIDTGYLSHEIHALERARAMHYDKKKDPSIRDMLKQKTAIKIPKKSIEIIVAVSPKNTKKVVTKTIAVPVKKVAKKAIAVPVKKVVAKTIAAPVKKVTKKAIAVPVKKVVAKTIAVPVKKVVAKTIAVPVKKVVAKKS